MLGSPVQQLWVMVTAYAKAGSAALACWNTMRMLLLRPSLLLHSLPPLAKPWLYVISPQHEPASLATALMPHAPHPSMVWGAQLWKKACLAQSPQWWCLKGKTSSTWTLLSCRFGEMWVPRFRQKYLFQASFPKGSFLQLIFLHALSVIPLFAAFQQLGKK